MPTAVGGAITVLSVAVVVREEGRRRRAEVPQVPADAPAVVDPEGRPVSR